MKKKLSSILGALLLTIMLFGTSIHAEYDGYNTDRVNNNNITTRVNDNNMNRVNNDVRTRNVNTTNDLNDNRNKNNNCCSPQWYAQNIRTACYLHQY